ncbi:hypothetical protein GBAR_LOCUS3133 [Geodia barretti]|uniref:Uncharacterized protein n=1 Tax=Geodia barretti TaxID=519541 RepID=A0AA35W455_GEOBA|nr:hypothetical protein GBAR_LOCUS3133 [Geodia barretti]
MVGVRRRGGGRSSEDGPRGGATDSRTGTKEKSRRFPEVLTLPALPSTLYHSLLTPSPPPLETLDDIISTT